jgi:hypothetical protein
VHHKTHFYLKKIALNKNMISSKINATVLCHFYNEEYLLPFWLKHHRSIFTHGIMIDYHSTDKSVEIIKELCPTWEIRTTKNEMFDAYLVDKEVMEIENTLSGFKIVLNVTEFIIAKTDFNLTNDLCIGMKSYTALSDFKNPENEVEFINNIQRVCYKSDRGYRVIHSYQNGNYSVGRHFSNHPTTLSKDMYILWCGFYPWNDETLKRKCQIKDKIPESDKICGRGFHHLWNKEQMEYVLKNNESISISFDKDNFIAEQAIDKFQTISNNNFKQFQKNLLESYTFLRDEDDE